jgi:hypothetical protein
MTNPGKPPATRTPEAKYTHVSTQWKEGDFEVSSSNGMRFLVPSYHLFAAR